VGIEIPSVALSNPKTPPEMKTVDKTILAPAAAQENEEAESKPKQSEIDLVMKSLVQAAGIFNKRLRYSINEELGLVVVKVIDADTDKVIKELPEEEMQRLMVRLKQAIGLLVDETI
jgi:flagellar protein FlaG